MTPEELGKKIQEAREKIAAISQRELAERANNIAESDALSQRIVSEIEAGSRKLGVLELIDLAAALEIPLSYFVGGLQSELDEIETVMIEEMRLITDEADRWLAVSVVRTIRKTLNARRFSRND
jgi:transcriptional regulator with XRE-family HTH domain